MRVPTLCFLFCCACLSSNWAIAAKNNDTPTKSAAVKYLEELRDEAATKHDYARAAEIQAVIKSESKKVDAPKSAKTTDPCGNSKSSGTTQISKQVGETGKELAGAVKEGDAKKIRQLNSILDSLMTDVIPTNIGWSEGCNDADGKVKVEDNEDFFLGIYAGIEGTSLDGIKEETTARIGITAYNQLLRFRPYKSNDGGMFGRLEKSLFGEEYCKLSKDDPNCGFGFGIHGWLTTLLTSSAEQTEISTGDMAMAGQTPEEQDIESTFEAELGLFTPIIQKHQTRKGQLLFGPTAITSESKLNDSSSFNKRYYGGFRFAYSPEFYLDLLYGKTEGLPGRRAEIRYQMPVGNLTEDSRLLFGLAINVGAKDDEGLGDSVRLYLSWNTGINKIFAN